MKDTRVMWPETALHYITLVTSHNNTRTLSGAQAAAKGLRPDPYRGFGIYYGGNKFPHFINPSNKVAEQ